MPTYEYRCTKCGHKFEKFQSITAPAIKQCPACKKNSAQRLIGTGAGLIFKGSGFYITDYRSEGYKERAKAESGASETKAGDSAKDSGGKDSTAKSDSAAPAKAESTAPAKSDIKPTPAPKTSRKKPA
ncbi:MAG TPA: FmdB family zinc ribbon protein [Tepidisphaeraceae bacterium]|jgi:putative FmdB family regulatory protein|nr:FmdB family zinc ribbon protein [Tepidisphaeraceae bacterium]